MLDSTNCASLDRHHHVRDLVARGVKDIRNVRKLRARGDSHLSSAGTVLPVTLSTNVGYVTHCTYSFLVLARFFVADHRSLSPTTPNSTP